MGLKRPVSIVYYPSAMFDAHITVCQGQPKKHAKQRRLPSGTLLGLTNGIPCNQENRKEVGYPVVLS